MELDPPCLLPASFPQSFIPLFDKVLEVFHGTRKIKQKKNHDEGKRARTRVQREQSGWQREIKKIEVFESSQADWYSVSVPADAPREAARGTGEGETDG